MVRSRLCLAKREGKILCSLPYHFLLLLLTALVCTCSEENAKQLLKTWSDENNKYPKVEPKKASRVAKPASKRGRKDEEGKVIKA